jgi:hypothetical protein
MSVLLAPSGDRRRGDFSSVAWRDRPPFCPREIPSSENEDSPFFLPNGDLIFRVGEGNLNFVYRMKQDGTARNKVVADPIFDLKSVPLMAAGW